MKLTHVSKISKGGPKENMLNVHLWYYSPFYGLLSLCDVFPKSEGVLVSSDNENRTEPFPASQAITCCQWGEGCWEACPSSKSRFSVFGLKLCIHDHVWVSCRIFLCLCICAKTEYELCYFYTHSLKTDVPMWCTRMHFSVSVGTFNSKLSIVQWKAPGGVRWFKRLSCVMYAGHTSANTHLEITHTTAKPTCS